MRLTRMSFWPSQVTRRSIIRVRIAGHRAHHPVCLTELQSSHNGRPLFSSGHRGVGSLVTNWY
jgi:hypothetical protein